MARILCALALVVSSVARADDWPGWRGPTGMGQSPAKDLPLTWGGKDGSNILWKMPLFEGTGKVRFDQNQSSPIVQGDHIFVTLSYWPEGVVAEKQPPEHHVVCFHKSDGKRLWDTRIPAGPWLLKDLRGGYTVSTPAADADRVYVLFGSSVAAALDHKGEIVWRKEITPYAFDVALGTSPVLYRDTVLLLWDQLNRASKLIALDKKTGETKWEKKRPTAEWAHSTPTLATIKGAVQLLVGGANALQGLNPDDGDTLWSCGSPGGQIGDTVSPVLAGGIVYCDSGRGGGPGIAVDPTGAGDVSKTHLKWKVPRVAEGFGSPVSDGEYLYRLQNAGLVTCRKLSSGEQVYAGRLPGVAVAPSPVATADGRLYFANGGKSFVVKTGPKFEILGTGELGDPSQASPAVADGRLFVRGGRNLYCIGKK